MRPWMLLLPLLIGCNKEKNEDFVEIQGGFTHACGMKSDGSVLCWGGRPVTETRDASYNAFGVGYDTTCVIGGGTLECFGGERPPELEIPEGKFSSVAPGRSNSCALDTDGAIACWGVDPDPAPEGSYASMVGGSGVFGVLDDDGNATTFGSYAVATPNDAFAVLSAGYREVCGITDGGEVRCWADITVDDGDAEPTLDVPEGTGFTDVAAGYGHACALDDAGEAVCWGGSKAATNAPAGPFVDLAAGADYSCGLRKDKTVSCWGSITDPAE